MTKTKGIILTTAFLLLLSGCEQKEEPSNSISKIDSTEIIGHENISESIDPGYNLSDKTYISSTSNKVRKLKLNADSTFNLWDGEDEYTGSYLTEDNLLMIVITAHLEGDSWLNLEAPETEIFNIKNVNTLIDSSGEEYTLE